MQETIRAGGKRGVYVLVIILAAAALAAVAMLQRDEQSDRQDLGLLLSAVQRMTEAERIITVKYGQTYTAYRSPEAFVRIGDTLAAKLGLSAAQAAERADGHPVYETVKPLDNGLLLSLTLVGMGSQSEGEAYMWVKLEGKLDEINEPGIVVQMDIISKVLASLDITPKWQYAATGKLQQAYYLDRMDAQGSRQLSALLQPEFAAQPAEVYTDEQTVSLSLYSLKLQHSVKIGSHQVNIQASVHQNTTNGEQILTIAIPILSSEY